MRRTLECQKVGRFAQQALTSTHVSRFDRRETSVDLRHMCLEQCAITVQKPITYIDETRWTTKLPDAQNTSTQSTRSALRSHLKTSDRGRIFSHLTVNRPKDFELDVLRYTSSPNPFGSSVILWIRIFYFYHVLFDGRLGYNCSWNFLLFHTWPRISHIKVIWKFFHLSIYHSFGSWKLSIF